MDESAIMNQIGIKNSSHRAKIVSSLVLLRAKHNLRKWFFQSLKKKLFEFFKYVFKGK